MTTYIRKLPNNLMTWAQNTLNEQELQQFVQAVDKNNQLWNTYKSTGVIVEDYINDEILLSTTYNTEIALPSEEVIEISAGQTAVMASELIPWMDRYIAENGNPVIIEP
jgi:hypothetical protein